MPKKSLFVIAVTALLCACLLFWAGCGGDDSETTADEASAQASGEDNGAATDLEDLDDLETMLGDIEDLEATVKVTADGEEVVTWTSKQGSWRWDDPQDPESYVIYNKDEDKMWIVNDKVAQEMDGTGSEGSAWWGMSPAAMLQAFTIFPGEKSGDTWKISIPGEGSVEIELKGPQGLPTKMTTKSVSSDGSEEVEVIEFEYSNVGSVPDSTFELPADVTVQAMPDIEGMDIEVPSV